MPHLLSSTFKLLCFVRDPQSLVGRLPISNHLRDRLSSLTSLKHTLTVISLWISLVL